MIFRKTKFKFGNLFVKTTTFEGNNLGKEFI